MNSGIIFLNKQPGITSFDALRDIKRALGTGKVGHTGTLDKFACGLLIVMAGRALKLCRWFSNCDKKYEGRIHFGIQTDTLDPEGEEIASAAPPSRENVKNVLAQFTGNLMQEPPVYSAIHVNGKRASNLVRSGQMPVMTKRPVTVYKLELTGWNPPFADISVHCSSGTYIRSLARDIAIAAGSRGYLASLKRTQVGGFCLEETQTDECGKEIKVLPIDKNVISKLGLPWFEVTHQEAQAIFHGKPLEQIMDNKTINNSAVFFEETLIAIIEKIEGKWKYGCVM
ncbi:MAG: tRNA pseudouridine(55) synthase TruB [Treponema sp.]|jgi:tRNA pseudouridine55 synthase|nr:tRNA pseudouridine(55) synthase TruB [Treponema sp.]